MAQQKGIIPLKGTIGNITFYKSGDGYLAREKGGIDANRIATDRLFKEPVRTAQNLAERVQQEKYYVALYGHCFKTPLIAEWWGD